MLKSIRVPLLAFLAAIFLRLLNLTLRWKLVGISREDVRRLLSDSPVIFAFWHEQQVVLPLAYRYFAPKNARKISALISQHGDGRIAAETIKYFGLGSVAGSSSRGGREAVHEMLKILTGGAHVAITPDGPRGPRHVAKPGVVSIAQRSGIPIIPLGLSASKAWTLRSWDRMFIPKPGATVTVVVGAPITIERETSADQFNIHLGLVGQALADAALRAGSD